MAHVWIPSLLRDLTGGRSRAEVGGTTLGAVIDGLEAAYPGVRARLYPAGQLNPTIQILVDGRAADLGLREPVREQSEVHFLPMISGGSTST
jgi:sulfur-carrier protein